MNDRTGRPQEEEVRHGVSGDLRRRARERAADSVDRTASPTSSRTAARTSSRHRNTKGHAWIMEGQKRPSPMGFCSMYFRVVASASTARR